LTGNFIIPVSSYREQDMALWWDTIQILRPTVIYGYPSVLADFAAWMESNSCTYNAKGVYSSAEILYPHQRKLIEENFRCRVFNQYGSRETPCVACECPEGNMHVFTDFNRVEFGNGINGELGEIIVTPLYNTVQPLLRYSLGDSGKAKPGVCSCGRGYPMMDLEIARSRDFLYGKDGEKFYPGFFTRMMDNRKWIRSFQFRQVSPDTIYLFIVVEKSSDIEKKTKKLREELKKLIQKRMGKDMEFTVNVVDHIDRSSAGKHRFVVNEAVVK
jgi:phenylacetate-CoA ligase